MKDYTITDNSKFKEYGSHIPVLEYLFSTIVFHSCLEFGLGVFSTNFFLQNRVCLTSIETDSEWIDSFKKQKTINHTIIHHDNEDVHEVLDSELKNRKFDLAFVDGPRSSRWKCINKLACYTKLIVAHDTNKPSYEWHKVALPSNFSIFKFTKLEPWTTLYSSDENINMKLSSSELIESVT